MGRHHKPDCQAPPDNEFAFVRFFGPGIFGRMATQELPMFVFNRSAIAVLAPIALLVAVVLWSSLGRGSVSAPASGGEAVWVNRLTPTERAALKSFFK
jgi:hypothetical protein